MASNKFTRYPYVEEINIGLMVDRPVQLNYEYCKGCGKQGLGCIKPHRFFTFEGWLTIILALLETPPYTKHQVMQATCDANFFYPGGFDVGEIGRCIVCRRTDCTRPHRKYTREGYAKYQIELMDIPREEAMKRSNEEFRVYGGDWAWYPHNPHGEFRPPKEHDPPAQVRAPQPPSEGWPRANDDRYVAIMKTIRQAWKTESEGNSQAELLRLRIQFDQRWYHMSGEETPRFHMPWDDLPRPQADTGDGSPGQYAGSGGGFVPPGDGPRPLPGGQYGSGFPGQPSAGHPHTGAQQGYPSAAYNNISGMPNIFFSESGGMLGFTFTHHQGNQSQTYEFPSGGGPPRAKPQTSDQNHQPLGQPNAPPPPQQKPKYTGKDSKSDSKQEKDKPKEDPFENPFNHSIHWYAKTFFEKTKGESLETTRIWKETLSKKFRREWGRWARTVQMPWDQDPSLNDDERSSLEGVGARSPKETRSRSHGNMGSKVPFVDSFDGGFKRWKDSQKHGDKHGNRTSGNSDKAAFDEVFKKWKRSQGLEKDEGYRPSGRGCDAFDDSFTSWKKSGVNSSGVEAFDERFQKWKKSGAADPNVDAFEDRYQKWKNPRGRETRQHNHNASDGYDSDGSTGPYSPKALRGAGNEKYEDTRRDFEEMWTKKSRNKRGGELRDLRVAMEYSWLMRTGNDGKGDMMPWHSKSRKYVRRPSGSRSAAEAKEANNSWNRSRTDTSHLKSTQGHSRTAPNEKENNHAATSYPSKLRGPYGTDTKGKNGGERPYVYRSKAERQSDKLSKADQKYEEHKTKCSIDWYAARETTTGSPAELRRLAQMHQVKFELTTDDEGAKTKVMPWSRYMQSDNPGARALPRIIPPRLTPQSPTLQHGRAKQRTKSPQSQQPRQQSRQSPLCRCLLWIGRRQRRHEPPKHPNPMPPKDDTPKAQSGNNKANDQPLDRYEKTKKEFSRDWELMQAARMTAGSNIALKRLEQPHQVKFENAEHDERAKTEALRWTKYLCGDAGFKADSFAIPTTMPKNSGAKKPAITTKPAPAFIPH